MINIWGLYILAFLLSLLLTPLVRKLAGKFSVYAQHSDRTMHTGQIPKWGGLAIVISFYVSILVLCLLYPQYMQSALLIFTGSVVLLTMGAVDDKLDLNCNLKFFIELLLATTLAFFFWRIETVAILPGVVIDLGVLSYLITVFWIVGIINAVNMIDGLDGLATGFIIVISLFNALIAYLNGNVAIAAISMILAFSLLGFFRYNAFPARIFMGDSGSLSLGFILAISIVDASRIENGTISAIPVFLLLSFPILDTTLAIIRRLLRRQHPFRADQEHLHHLLLAKGNSHPKSVLLLIVAVFFFSILALMTSFWFDLII